MNSAIPHYPLLGLLIQEGPDYGYHLVARYNDAFTLLGSALPELGTSNVYAVIGALEKKGWIEESHQEPKGKLRRVYYRATPSGAKAWREWIVASFREDPVRHELLRRCCGVSDRAFLQVLDAYTERNLKEIAGLPRLREVTPDEIARMSRDERLQRHVQQHKRVVLAAELDWASRVRADVLAAIEYAEAHPDDKSEADGRPAVA